MYRKFNEVRLISRKLRKLLAVVAGALAAGVPVAVIHRGIDTYIERQGAEEVRLAAQRAVARAEWRIGQSGPAAERLRRSAPHVPVWRRRYSSTPNEGEGNRVAGQRDRR